MDILDSMEAQPEPVDLDSLVDVRPLDTLSPPDASIRNRSAQTAALTDNPDKAVSNYNLMMHEGSQGQSSTYKALQDGIHQQTNQLDTQATLRILGDPSIPIEKKKQAIQGLQNSQFLKDTGVVLHSNSLAAGSDGENQDQEDARLSSVDAIREIYNARSEVQGLANAYTESLTRVGHLKELASRNNTTPGANAQVSSSVADIITSYVAPLNNSITMGKTIAGTNAATGQTRSTWQAIKDFVLPGSATASLRDKLLSIPPEKRVDFTKAIIGSIKENNSAIFGNDNQYSAFDKAQAVFQQGGYSSSAEFLDNAGAILDIVGLGGMVKGLAKKAGVGAANAAGEAAAGAGTHTPGSSGGGPAAEKATWELVDDRPINPFAAQIGEQAKRIEMNGPIRIENPASTANIYQQSNPEKARAVHDAVYNDTGDQISNALYGAPRANAMAADAMPQVATESQAVTSKVQDIDRNLRRDIQPDPSVVDFIDNTGAIYFTDKEKAAARANVVNDFQNATGIEMNTAMSSFDMIGGKININAVYGTAEGGFTSASDALTQTKLALRRYGVQDGDIQLLAKQGLDHVPVSLDKVGDTPGNYMVRVKTAHEFDPTDVGRMESLDVKRNLFDRVSWTVSNHGGSVSRYIMDAASMMHPTISGSAVIATDRSAGLSKLLLQGASDFADKFMALPKERRSALDQYIREANYKEIDFDPVHMASQGYSPAEMETVKSWRSFWDGHYYLENNDVVRSLKTNGYGVIEHQNATLYAREIPKNSKVGYIYDVGMDKIKQLTPQEMDGLYQSGGTLAVLRRPATIQGTEIEHIMVRNNASEYIRGLKPTDQVLNYRKGYYQLKYTAPQYVEQIMKDASGKETGRKVVAVAGSKKEADFFAERMKKTSGEDYNVRGDTRALRTDSDANWDLQSAGGRLSQRHRGKLLEDSSGANHLGDGDYIRNPVDSAVMAANSIANRTTTRPMIEAAKARFLQQFEEALPKRNGLTVWPEKVGQIGEHGKGTSKLSADARTTYEYINYLENGYINGIDEAYKGLMNMTANMLGNAHITTGEKAFNWLSTTSPTSIGKNTAFMAYIATNPIRQWIIQPHQVIRTMVYNPKGWATGRIESNITAFLSDAAGLGTLSKEQEAFKTFVVSSGMLDAVDKHNLVRGALMDMKKSSDIITGTIGKGIDLTRKIGFDTGEQANLLGHLAAVYDLHLQKGVNLTDPALRDKAYSEARALAYDMNFAGDMPYNQTAPGMVLQFMQMPHKAIAQYTNRRIDGAMRLRLAGADLLLWGTPAALIGSMLGTDILPNNKDLRDTFLHGLESVVLNKFFTDLSGERVNIDFSGLAPADMTGWGGFFTAMYTGGIDKVVMNSPGGQLLFKNAAEGGRIQTAIKSMARYFGAFEDIDETHQEFTSVMSDVLKISSGFSNAVKAKILLDGNKRLDAYGNVVADKASTVEAWAQAFGFGSGDARDLYEISKNISDDTKQHKKDVVAVYNETKRYYAEQLQLEATDPKFITKVTGRMLLVFKDDVVAQQIIQQQLKQDLAGKDAGLLKEFMKRSLIPSAANLKDQVNQMPVDDHQKELMMQRIEDVQKATAPLTKEKKHR